MYDTNSKLCRIDWGTIDPITCLLREHKVPFRSPKIEGLVKASSLPLEGDVMHIVHVGAQIS